MISLQEQRAGRVREAFSELPERYLGVPEDVEATFQIRLGDVGRTWEVIARPDRCEVHPSPTRKPDVIIGSDAATWLALREGRLSGVDAFAQRRLWVRGDLDYALGFEGLFRLPDDRDPLLRIRRVETERGTLTSLIAGHGPEHVVCLHGLGSNKASFFETVAALAVDHTVHAIDLPGFGSSDKPARGRYNAPWFSTAVLGYLDARGIDRAHLIGNSMGGRVALEVGFEAPERVSSVSLLAPALAFRKRQLAPIIRMLRPELAVIPHVLREQLVRAQFRALFADPERLDPAAADVAVQEFVRLYKRRVLRRGTQHLLGRAARGGRVLRPPLAPRAAGPLHLGRRRHAHPRKVLPPRREGAARRRSGDPHRLRPRSAGRAARSDQPADPRPNRFRRRARRRVAGRRFAASAPRQLTRDGDTLTQPLYHRRDG
jgi:pimeloyl-ACP methyl ester carboxylesterase/putative sterol carrier protein